MIAFHNQKDEPWLHFTTKKYLYCKKEIKREVTIPMIQKYT
jgi:hypothetical protein